MNSPPNGPLRAGNNKHNHQSEHQNEHQGQNRHQASKRTIVLNRTSRLPAIPRPVVPRPLPTMTRL